MKEPNYKSIKKVLAALTFEPQSFNNIRSKVGKISPETARKALDALIDLGLARKIVAPRSLWTSNISHPSFAWQKTTNSNHREQEL
jgi:DNA-binding HxlR family transcriptional regulator